MSDFDGIGRVYKEAAKECQAFADQVVKDYQLAAESARKYLEANQTAFKNLPPKLNPDQVVKSGIESAARTANEMLEQIRKTAETVERELGQHWTDLGINLKRPEKDDNSLNHVAGGGSR